jgi:S-adenosylmethionine hydrolase
MLVLVTDFGLEGPYTGQMKAVLQAGAPGAPVIDLFADAPAFEPQLTAYLLPAYSVGFPPGSIFLVIVDPGVGSTRRAIALKADEYWYVGPDNGVFELILRRASQVEAWEISHPAHAISASFHGRDLFAPAAVQIAREGGLPGAAPVSPARFPAWPEDLPAIVYVDRYGNLVTGIRAAGIGDERVLRCAGRDITHARVFSDVPQGELFWYENANGLAEIAANRCSAARILMTGLSDAVELALRPGRI